MIHSFVSEWNILAAAVWAALFNSLAAVCILTGCAWLLMERMKGWSAASRYAGWCGVLVLAIALPAAQFFLPHEAAIAMDPLIVPVGVPAVIDSAPIVIDSAPMAAAPLPLPVDVRKSSAPPERFNGFTAGGIILLLWALATAVELTRLLFALRHCYRLKRSAAAPDGELNERWRELLRRNNDVRRPVRLAISSRVTMPAVVGYRRPVVLLPATLAAQLTEDQMDGILLHELAHVRRHDDWAIAAQRCLQALFALHPLVHLIASKMELQREIACDDWVLQTQQARVYASSLTTVAEYCLRPAHSGLMGLAMEEPSQLGERVELLLDSKRSIATRISWRWFGSFASLLGLAGAVSLQIPEVMAFPVQAAPAKPATVAVATPGPVVSPMPVVAVAPVADPDPMPVVVSPEAPVQAKDGHSDEAARELARQQRALSAQQRELGRKQAELVRRQMELARKQMDQAHVQMGLELREKLEPQMRQLREQLSHMNLDQTVRSAVQAQIQAGIIQSKMAHLEGLDALSHGDWMGTRGRLSEEEMNKIRAEQKRYEAQAAALGAQQAQAAKEFRDRVNQIVRDALAREGTAAPKK